MRFLVHWSGLVLIASSVVLSVLLWSRQRDARVLLLSGLLAATTLRFVLSLVGVDHGVEASPLVGWVQLAIAGLGVAAVLGLDQLLTSERRRRRAISKIEGALQEFGVGTPATGHEFLRLAARRLSELLETDFAFIAELADEGTTVHLLALSERGADAEPFSYPLAGSLCEQVVGAGPWSLAEGARSAFGHDAVVGRLGIESYLGVPLTGGNGEPIGLVGAMGRSAIVDPATLLPALRILASRAQVELLRDRHDRELRESERRFRVLFEESQDALCITRPDGRALDANPSAVMLFGYESREEMLARFVAANHYLDAGERPAVMAMLEKDGVVRDLSLEVKRCNGEVLSLMVAATAERDDEGKIVSVRATLRDVTAEHELQRQLLRAQRMEAVGRMAGGVAQDFSNLLTVINGHSDLILSGLEEDSPVTGDVLEIKGAVQRAAAFTRRLLLLSRRKLLAPQAIDLNEVIEDLSPLLQRAVGDDIVQTLELEPGAGGVIADATEMEQVLLNLVINARDAMPAGGPLRIRTRALAEAPPAAHARGLTGGPWVELSVEDEGLGIEPEVIDRIFEPFFTTKDATIGTGLGLSTVYGIVKQLRGDVSVTSTVGVGTRFSILIPAVGHAALPVVSSSDAA